MKKLKKFYIYRIHLKTGRKEYKRTKCLDRWTSESNKHLCWKFSQQGAKKIVAQESEWDRAGFYEFGMEAVDIL